MSKIAGFAWSPVIVALLMLIPKAGFAEGHGPVFALATPTLGRGQFSSDSSVVVSGAGAASAMFGQMFAYGITEDWEANLSMASPMINRQSPMPRFRAGSMMDAAGGEVGFQTRYRFHKEYPGGGQRLESTIAVGGTAPYQSKPGEMELGPSVHVSLTTGYASRTWYWWLGGGYQRSFERKGDRRGDLPYATAAVGYRPPAWAKDYPEADWRVFMESVAEFPGRRRVDGHTMPNSGGERILIGPSVLGLFGPWGVSGGALFPIYQNMRGTDREERFRARLLFTYWF